MDLLAKKRMLLVLSMLLAGPALAQENLYQLSVVDYFMLRRAVKTGEVSLWGEEAPVPAPVVDLLEDPRESTARRYLEWSRERLARVARAQRAVDDVERMMPAGEGP